MDFRVREATVHDYEGLSNIFAEVDAMHSEALPHIFKESEGPARSLEFISDTIVDQDTVLFVAESDGRIIGLVHVRIRESPRLSTVIRRRYAYIDEIAVTREARGSTVGRALMEEAERWAIQKGASELELNVWAFNTGATGFFQRLGYKMARHGMWKPVVEDSPDNRT